MYFQDLIEALNRYWIKQGCIVIQPLDMEVGAGTFHPATFFGSLGDRPQRAIVQERVGGASSNLRPPLRARQSRPPAWGLRHTHLG